jgi:hypothetical protein
MRPWRPAASRGFSAHPTSKGVILLGLGILALGTMLSACGESMPAQEREARRLLESVEGVTRIDTIELRRTTWGRWRDVSHDDLAFDDYEQPVADDADVHVIAVTGQVEPLAGTGGAREWGIIVLDASSGLEISREIGPGQMPDYFERI